MDREKQQGESKEKRIPVRDAESEAAVEEQEPIAAEVEGTPEAAESVPDERGVPQDELAQLKVRVAELEDSRLRAMADFENFKRRTARQYEEMIQAGNERLLNDLLEVADNFERALKHDDERPGERTEEGKAFRRGTEMIYNQLQALLEKYDVRPIESLGQPFDPQFHEALMQIASDEYEEGVVAMEMARGYQRGDRVLRHAKVGVSRGKDSSKGNAE